MECEGGGEGDRGEIRGEVKNIPILSFFALKNSHFGNLFVSLQKKK